MERVNDYFIIYMSNNDSSPTDSIGYLLVR